MGVDDAENEEAWRIWQRLMHPIQEHYSSTLHDLRLMVHFTGFSAFSNIIKSKEIWFCPVSAMNDLAEVNLGKDQIYNAASEDGPLWPSLTSIETVHPQIFEQMRSAFFNRINHDRDDTFVSCWSYYGDSETEYGRRPYDDLSMWRAYGGAGNGVALVLDPAVLHKHSLLDGYMLSAKVQYSSRHQFQNFAAAIFNSFAATVNSLPKEMADKHSALIVETFAEVCFQLAITKKDVGFEAEKEWRLIWNRKHWVEDDPLHHCVRAEVTPNGLFERLCLPFGDSELGHPEEVKLSDALLSVLIGPCEHADLKAKAVRSLLNSYGFENVIVEPSHIPFRG